MQHIACFQGLAIAASRALGETVCRIALGLGLSLLAQGAVAQAPAAAGAQIKFMLALDPSAAVGRGLQMAQANRSLETSLARSVQLDYSSDYANILRSTRTGEYDVYIAPAHVIASALNHGYNVLASSGTAESYVLVVKPGVQSAADLKGKKIYLPHQDSLYSYLAKGLINEGGGALSQAAYVDYQRTASAGLIALQMGTFDATVVRKSEYVEWAKSAVGIGKVLAESPAVPSGMSVAVKKDIPEPLRNKLVQWTLSAAASNAGIGTLKAYTVGGEASGYKYLANLGHFTPNALPNVERVDAARADALMKQGAVLVDVRSEKEFKAKHIAGAVLAPYLEKSLKEVSYKSELDDFSALTKLPKDKPVIFSCNGAECWKSYKASKTASAQGFTKVYWLRGGLPEWEAAGMPLVKE